MEPLRISNSMLRDWEELCPIQFQARWIDKTVEWQETQPMRWGNIFETLAIGKGVRGKAVMPTPTELKSVLYPRAKAQAADCREYIKKRGKVIAYQSYENAEVIDSQGQTIPIMGGKDIDILFTDLPEPKRGIIDLKFTGDTDSTFGKFAWGKPETMDMSQLIHYGLIHQFHYNEWPRLEYWVFDGKPAKKKIMLEVEFSEYQIFEHIERVSRCYNEIMMAIDFLGFQPRNTFENCNTCIKSIQENCKHRRTMPEIIKIYK